MLRIGDRDPRDLLRLQAQLPGPVPAEVRVSGRDARRYKGRQLLLALGLGSGAEVQVDLAELGRVSLGQGHWELAACGAGLAGPSAWGTLGWLKKMAVMPRYAMISRVAHNATRSGHSSHRPPAPLQGRLACQSSPGRPASFPGIPRPRPGSRTAALP